MLWNLYCEPLTDSCEVGLGWYSLIMHLVCYHNNVHVALHVEFFGEDNTQVIGP